MTNLSRETTLIQKIAAFCGVFLILFSVWAPLILSQPSKAVAADEETDSFDEGQYDEIISGPVDQAVINTKIAETLANNSINNLSNQVADMAQFSDFASLGQRIILNATDRAILAAYLTPDTFAQSMQGKTVDNDATVNEMFNLAFNPEKLALLMADKDKNTKVQENIKKVISEKLSIKTELTGDQKTLCEDLLNSEKDNQINQLNSQDEATQAARNAAVGARNDLKLKNKNLCVAYGLQKVAQVFKDNSGDREKSVAVAPAVSNGLKILLEIPWWYALQPVTGEVVKTLLQPLQFRTVESLIYLVTPKNMGGAGHERIKVSIWSPSSGEIAEKDSASLERHKTGDAYDVEAADYLYCTLIKRRRLSSDSFIPQPATSIEMAYQSETGIVKSAQFNQFSGALHDAILKNGAQNWIDIFGLNAQDMDTNAFAKGDFGSMAKTVGLAALANVVNSPAGGMNGTNFPEIIQNTGKGVLASYLGLPASALAGNTLDEIEIATGRATLEEKMNLPEGSLAGNNSDEILASVGRRKVEGLLKLRKDGLLVTGNPGSTGALYKVIGQAKLEEAFNVTKGTLNSDQVSEFKKKILPAKWDYLKGTANPTDAALYLPYGTTAKLMFSNTPDLGQLKFLVGQKTIETELLIYRKNKDLNIVDPEDNMRQETAWGIKAPTSTTRNFKSAPPQAGEIINAFKNGNFGVFTEIGMSELAINLTTGDSSQNDLISWLNTNGLSGAYPPQTVNSRLGIDTGEFDRLFIVKDEKTNQTQIQSVFRNVGQKRLINTVKQTAPVAEKVAEVAQEINFYSSRVDRLKSNNARIKQIINNNKTSVYYDADEKEAIAQIEKTIGDVFSKPSIGNFQTASQKIKKSLDVLEARNAVRGQRTDLPQEVKDQLKNDYEEIKAKILDSRHTISEILEGEVLPTDASQIDGASDNLVDNNKAKKWQLDPKEVLKVLTGQQNWVQFIQKIGLGQLETEYALPPNSLSYFLQSGSDAPNSFTESLGQAAIEKELKLPSGSFSGNDILEISLKIEEKTNQSDGPVVIAKAFNFPSNNFMYLANGASYQKTGAEYENLKTSLANNQYWQAVKDSVYLTDDRLKITRGSSELLIQGLISPTEFKMRVGREQEKVSALSKVSEQWDNDLLGYRPNGDDLYNVLSGNPGALAAKVGGHKLEQTLKLSPGAGVALINANSNDERLQIIADNGFASWAKDLGLLRNAQQYIRKRKTEQTAAQNLGSGKVEENLALAPGSFAGTIEDVRNASGNESYWFANAFGMPIEDIINNFDSKQVITKEQSLAVDKRVDSVMDPNSVFWQPPTAFGQVSDANMSDLLKFPMDDAFRNSIVNKEHTANYYLFMIADFQAQVQAIDAGFWLNNDSTKKLLTRQMSVELYSASVGQGTVAGLPKPSDKNYNDAVDLLLEKLGVDPVKRASLKGTITSTANLIKNNQKLSDLTPIQQADLYENLSNVFDVNVDDKLHFRQGSVSKMIRDPKNAQTVFFEEGILQLEVSLGLADDKNTQYVEPSQKEGESDADYTIRKNSAPFDQHPLLATYTTYMREGVPGLKDLGQNVIADLMRGKIEAALRKNTKDGAAYSAQDYFDASTDARNLLLSGDTRFLGTMSLMVYSGGLNLPFTVTKNGVDQEITLPDAYKITYADNKRQSEGWFGGEEATIKDAGKTAYDNGVNAIQKMADKDQLEVLNIAFDPNKPKAERDAADYVAVNGTYYSGDTDYVSQYADSQKAIAEEDEKDKINLNRNDMTYKSMDIALYRKDQSVPAGFAKGLFGPGADSGTRWNSVMGYLSNQVFDNQYIVPALLQFSIDKNLDTLATSLTDSGFALINQKLSNLLGVDLPPDTAKGIFALIKTGKINESVTTALGKTFPALTTTAHDLIVGKLYTYVDSSLGLQPGTSQKLYDAYKLYKNYLVLKNSATATTAQIAQARQAFKAAIVTILVELALSYYSEQIMKFEMDVGLVPGSISTGISMGVSASLAWGGPAGWAVGVGIFLIMNAFGVYRIELQCTGDGYWPYNDPELGQFGGSDMRRYSYENGNWSYDYPGSGMLPGYRKQITNPIQIALLNKKKGLDMGLGWFDGMENNSMRGGMVKTAQAKTRQVVTDLLNIRTSGIQTNLNQTLGVNTEDLRPVQMFSLRKDDESFFQSSNLLDENYGAAASRGNSGYWADPRAVDFIHVGY